MFTILTVFMLLCSFANGQVRFDLRLVVNNPILGAGGIVPFIGVNNIAGLQNQGGGVLKVDVSGQYYLGVYFRCLNMFMLRIVVNAIPTAMGYCRRGAGSIMSVKELKTGDTLSVRSIGAGNINIMRPARFVGFII